MSKANMPNLHPCVVDSLIDPVKFPNAFRLATNNQQWDTAAVGYIADILKLKKVAIITDTTGYGTTAAAASAAHLGKRGVTVTTNAQIDSTQADISADMLRAKNGGADVILIWTVSTGLMSRVMNQRGILGWKVPIVGHPSLGSGGIGGLLEKKEYWEDVFQVSFFNACYGPDGKLPARSQAFFDKISGKIKLEDTNFWWIAGGYDAVRLVASAVEATGSSDADAIIRHWNSLSSYPGIYGTYSFSPTEHNGFPTKEVVMSRANSNRNGTFGLAPGYA
jgi:branched-chain amino acid transport system substrate-binding protein